MLATMHGKEKVIAPLLHEKLGVTVIVPEHFDSDQFGTFTRDIARRGNQLEAARQKALAAMELTGLDLGIASEGSFGPDPDVPYVHANLELLLLIDAKHHIEIAAYHRSSETNLAGQYVSTPEEALAFATCVGFPQHAVVVRKSETSRRSIYKGIQTEPALREAVEKVLRGFFIQRAYVETDMRAHMNPTRMANIAKATQQLIENSTATCPSCGTPGFVIMGATDTLHCSRCDQPTQTPRTYVRRCQACGTTHDTVRNDKKTEDPSLCGWCNP